MGYYLWPIRSWAMRPLAQTIDSRLLIFCGYKLRFPPCPPFLLINLIQFLVWRQFLCPNTNKTVRQPFGKGREAPPWTRACVRRPRWTRAMSGHRGQDREAPSGQERPPAPVDERAMSGLRGQEREAPPWTRAPAGRYGQDQGPASEDKADKMLPWTRAKAGLVGKR
jgi:hypothetical protein